MQDNSRKPNAPPGSLHPDGSAFRDKGGYDHEEVRCDEMADSDCDNKMVGEPRTCCVCAGHDCAEARAERMKHPKRISPNSGHQPNPRAKDKLKPDQ